MKDLYLEACGILRITPNTQILEAFEEDGFMRDRFILPTNYIGDKGARAILPILKENSSLKYLSLEKQGIRTGAALDIAEYFLYHPGILTIDLQHNQIGQKGANELYQMFLKNENLKEIRMEGNPIDWRLLDKFKALYDERERQTVRVVPTEPASIPPEWAEIDIDESQSLAPIFTASPSLSNFSIFDSSRLPPYDDPSRVFPSNPSNKRIV